MSDIEKVLSVIFLCLFVVAGVVGSWPSALLVAAAFGVGILFPSDREET